MIFSVTNALLNLVLVSIPEETFIVVMTLILLKRYDMLDIRMWRQNLKWIMVPVIPVAIMINLFRYIIIIPKPIISLICLISMPLLLILVIKNNSFMIDKKVIIRTVIYTIFSFVMVGLIELSYYPLALSLLHTNMSFFDNNILFNLLITIPARVIQICIIVFIIMKKNNEIQIHLFKTISKNKFLTNSFLAMLITIMSIIIYIAKLVMVDSFLSNIRVIDQLITTIIILAVPVISITFFLMFVNYLLVKEKQIQQTYENLVIQDDITDVDN